jgi:glycosyltransferase involved in cell wall biosynthesis
VRILSVIQELGPGGAERVVLSVVAGLSGSGHAMAVAAAPGPWTAELPSGVESFSLPRIERRPHRTVAGAWQLGKAIKTFGPDVVHAHNPGMAVLTALATRRGGKVPAIVSFHGVPEADYPAAARVLRGARLPVVACGPGVAAALHEQGVDVMATVVNGISLPAPRAADRSSLGIADDSTLVVAVGRLVEQKDHATAISAMAALPTSVVLMIVGAGPLEAGLRAQAESIGVGDRVVLAGARPDARSILAAADVALLPSRWEGLPLVGLEALAAGVPLVATAARGTRELLHDGEDALLVPVGSSVDLSAAIGRLLGDDALRERLRAAGPNLAARYSEAAMVDGFLALYREMAS